MFNYISRSSLIVVLLLALFAVPMVSAQENADLTEEELALLDRVVEARARLDEFGSFVEESAQTQSQALSINMGETSQAFNQSVTAERTQTVIHGEDGRNIAGTVVATVSESEPLPNGQPGTVSYVLNAEFRLVDETMYVNAVYESPDPTLPEIPEGWTIFTEGANEAIDFLGLDDVVEEQDPLEREERLKTTAQDVTLESATLEDGTEVEVITITFNQDAFAEYLGGAEEQEGNPMTGALLAAMSENSSMMMMVTLDLEGNPLLVESSFMLEAPEMVGSEIDPTTFPEGMTLDMVLEFTESQSYSQFDGEFEPAVAPEDVAE